MNGRLSPGRWKHSLATREVLWVGTFCVIASPQRCRFPLCVCMMNFDLGVVSIRWDFPLLPALYLAQTDRHTHTYIRAQWVCARVGWGVGPGRHKLLYFNSCVAKKEKENCSLKNSLFFVRSSLSDFIKPFCKTRILLVRNNLTDSPFFGAHYVSLCCFCCNLQTYSG